MRHMISEVCFTPELKTSLANAKDLQKNWRKRSSGICTWEKWFLLRGFAIVREETTLETMSPVKISSLLEILHIADHGSKNDIPHVKFTHFFIDCYYLIKSCVSGLWGSLRTIWLPYNNKE